MEKTKAGEYRRKVYFIEKSFQAKFILKFCMLVIIGGLCTIGLLYVLARQSTTVAFVNSRVYVRTTADFILPLLIQTLAIVLILVGVATIALTLFVSHKIAGPLYRLKMVMQLIGKGDFSADYRIRHSDQLQDLANTFNAAISDIKSNLNTLKHNFILLKEKLDSIPEHEIKEHKRQCFNELRNITKELGDSINYFKT